MSRFLSTRYTNSEVSFNKPIGSENEAELGDIIEDKDYAFENIEEQIYLKQIRNLLETAMRQINSLSELNILKLKYGWDSKPLPMKEI